jgi:hypothetical protein
MNQLGCVRLCTATALLHDVPRNPAPVAQASSSGPAPPVGQPPVALDLVEKLPPEQDTLGSGQLVLLETRLHSDDQAVRDAMITVPACLAG